MNQSQIVNKIYYGYKQAAKRLGAEVTIYRSANAINPISPANMPDPATVLASFPVDMSYSKFQKYGAAVYTGIFDARVTHPQDFLVEQDGTTYFIGSQEPIAPILIVICNSIITVKRPYGSTSGGVQPYSGRTAETDVTLYENVPGSVLLKTTKGVSNNVGLPTDTRQPLYTCLIPFLGNVQLLTGDIATIEWISGDIPTNLVVWQVELTNLGYRLQLEELGA